MKWNLGKWNLGKYDVPDSDSEEGAALSPVRMELEVSAATATRHIRLEAGPVLMESTADAMPTLHRLARCEAVDMGLAASALATLRRPMEAIPAEWEVSVSAIIARTYGLDTIALPGLALNPGETLVIDTEKITVEKDGKNVIEYWLTGSSPFSFSNGRNLITYYDDNGARQAAASVVWRDRWL